MALGILETAQKRRILIFVVAYNAERTIQEVIRRVPACLLEHDTEILIIDDASHDQTFQKARAFDRCPFPMTVLFNPVNQGYGGNQKIGFHYAIRENFEIVALVHGDGQYAPELLPDLLSPLLNGDADAVFGSRMMASFGALKGGMPLYKYLGNRILTTIQNWLLKTSFSEFHSGYRLYSVDALKRLPFERNTSNFHFDTEIIIQLLRAGLRIREMPIPTYYGTEICHVNGLLYALNVLKTTILSRAQDLGLFYERKFDLGGPRYQPKLEYQSPHKLALERITPGSIVADIGCSSGYMASALKQKGCRVTGIDQFPVAADVPFDCFIQHNLNDSDFPLDAGAFDYILLLDVLEHLLSPESFVDALRSSRRQGADSLVIVSTGNIGFFVTRFMLLLGSFNYGPRGILDLTHTRLFTFSTFRKLFEQAGYRIEEIRGIPAPFRLALGDGEAAKWLLVINKLLIRLSKTLFSYQIFMVVRPLPSLETLLGRAFQSRPETTASGFKNLYH